MTSYKNANFEFESLPVNCIVGGAGFPILMIHGSGPGASTLGNWRLVLGPLAERYHIHAMDLIGFGESGRRPAPPYFDVDFWVRQCRALIDRMPGEKIGIIGHSLSGALALKLAAAEKRVAKVLTTGSMGAPTKVSEYTLRCWTAPRDKSELLAMAQATIHDQRHVTEAWIAGRVKVLFDDESYAPYFNRMFEGNRQKYMDEAVVTDSELANITCDLTMIHGREDLAFPPSVSIEIAGKLRKADLILLANCSHSVALEFPEKLLSAARLLFG
jgi:2-hydroxymuconate-semialdehyde hydrolase